MTKREESQHIYEQTDKAKARKAAQRERSGKSSPKIHFGVTVKLGPKYGLNISRQTYESITKRTSTFVAREEDPEHWDKQSAMFDDSDHLFYTDEWCDRHQLAALENFDINMDKYASLDKGQFDGHLNNVIVAHPGMAEVTNLNDWEGVIALYRWFSIVFYRYTLELLGGPEG